MRKTAFLVAALLALLVLPALALLGSGSAPALAAKAKQKDKAAAATSAYGGVAGTVTSVQNGVLALTTEQSKQVSFSTGSYTLVLKGGMASASALRAGDRVLVNPDFKAIAGDNAQRNSTAADPRESKAADKPPASNPHPGNSGGEGAPGPASDRAAAPTQPNPDNKNVPAGASGQPGTAANNKGATGAREGATGALTPARIVWVQQQGETLVYGLVRSVSGGTVVLKTGAQTQANVMVSTSTVYTRQMPEGAAGSKTASRTDLKQGSHVVIVASGQSAKVVLFINPPVNADANAAKANK